MTRSRERPSRRSRRSRSRSPKSRSSSRRQRSRSPDKDRHKSSHTKERKSSSSSSSSKSKSLGSIGFRVSAPGTERKRTHKPSSRKKRHKSSFNAFETKEKEKEKELDPEQQKRLERLEAWKRAKLVDGAEAPADPPEAPKRDPAAPAGPEEDAVDAGVDPLDAYMQSLVQDPEPTGTSKKQVAADAESKERFFDLHDVYSEDDLEHMGDEEMSWVKTREQRFKKKEIKAVNHSQIDYPTFRKNFYVEAKEIKQMTDEEVAAYRKDNLDGVKIRGKDCPRPLQKWTQCGLSMKMLSLLTKYGYTAPFPIQAQAIPVIMSGRDAICCAKTGSGKTLAFVLPMLRHVMDQPPLEDKDGPIGLILAPTRELAIQIHAEVKKFGRPLGLTSVCCYGGTGIAEQIAMLKRGAEIIVATPGRLIDMLCANQGRVTNLRRVTYVVLDEADRMFDMGFEPQVSAVLVNTRPDRQTVMFSATFPKQIEGLAKKGLTRPVEIIIGGRSVASNTVRQNIEVIDANAKFRRLLQLLGNWYEKGNILIFVDRQEAVDNLFSELMKSGYMCLALHGGMDQSDRDYTILDFKKKNRTIMVATSVAARGLDVKELRLVVNYTVPNHYEDYVHRVGRTGRAGTKGTAFTFITPEEDRFAADMVKALTAAKTPVPAALQELADAFAAKMKSGEAKYGSHSGYSTGKGFKFDEEEAKKKMKDQQRQRRTYGLAEDRDSEEEAEEDKKEAEERSKALASSMKLSDSDVDETPTDAQDAIAQQVARLKAATKAASVAQKRGSQDDAIATMQQAKAKAALMSLQLKMGTDAMPLIGGDGQAQGEDYFCEELEINDYPQHARWKVTHRREMAHITEMTDVAITSRGSYIPAGRKPAAGERKLYLLIEGKSRNAVRQGKKEIRRVLEETAAQSKPDDSAYSRYSVV